ncbi:MAG: universal stress protein [Streptomycetaceae bacterium]|nr:universal stress protein [Streptomycetaceae bacterium]
MEQIPSLLPHAAHARQVLSSRVLRRHVVAGVDGSDASLAALDQAVVEAVHRQVPLEIVYGWPWEPRDTAVFGLAHEIALAPADAARMVLHLAEVRAHQQAPQLQVRQTLTTEDASTALLQRGADAALTVVGSRALGRLRAMVLGSVGARLVAQATYPVLVVHDAARVRKRKRIVVGVGGEEDACAVRFAVEEAHRTDSHLLVLHACTHPQADGHGRDGHDGHGRGGDGRGGDRGEEHARAAMAVTAAGTALATYPDVTVETATVHDEADHALTIASRDADLLVIARHPHHRTFGAHLGPVAHQVLLHSHCPVALIPAG